MEDVRPIWRECFRILRPGGRLLAGTDHYINYIVDSEEKRIVNSLPFNPLLNPDQRKQLEAEDAGMQFSHSLEEQIGGQLEAGFRLIALYEDTNGEGRQRSRLTKTDRGAEEESYYGLQEIWKHSGGQNRPL